MSHSDEEIKDIVMNGKHQPQNNSLHDVITRSPEMLKLFEECLYD